MERLFSVTLLAGLVTGLFTGLGATAALAGLKPGDTAPDFTAQAAVGGKDFTFSLADAVNDHRLKAVASNYG